MTSRERVLRAMTFQSPDRIPLCLKFFDSENITAELEQTYESDILFAGCSDPDFVPVKEGYSIWGYKMETMGETMGEVKEFPLESWENFGEWARHLPDFTKESAFTGAKKLREENPNKYLVGELGLMMEEIINLRGYENFMMDYYEEEDNLKKLISLLYEIGKQLVDGYAAAGMDAVMAWEDWGLQNGPMIKYDLWKEFYYEKMKDFIAYIHSKGMQYILHSCGHIVYLIDTFIDLGVDVLQMDQQMNIGFSVLKNWQGKVCFMCPVDIQHSANMTEEEVSKYIGEMLCNLQTAKGGFIYKPYAIPNSIHVKKETIKAGIDSVLAISSLI